MNKMDVDVVLLHGLDFAFRRMRRCSDDRPFYSLRIQKSSGRSIVVPNLPNNAWSLDKQVERSSGAQYSHTDSVEAMFEVPVDPALIETL